MKLAFTLLGAAAAVLQASSGTSPPVRAALRSSWPAPPFLAEILETVALENPNGFFTYLEALTSPLSHISPSLSPEALHQAALQAAADNGLLNDPGSLEMVQMQLAMHAAAPKLAAFYSYYADTHNGSSGAQCGSWVDWYGEVVCDVETLAQLAGKEAIDAPDAPPPQPRPQILTFDHIFPLPQDILERPPRTAILYASLASKNFRELHTYLLKLTNRPDPHVEYVFRHIPPASASAGENGEKEKEKNYLSGYGVALDLKKTDYLAVDDRQLGSGARAANADNEPDAQTLDPLLPLIMAHPENTTAPPPDVPLTEEEIDSLGPKAAQLIADSPTPLLTLTHLAHNFPKYTAALARRVVAHPRLISELANNSLKVQRGAGAFWLNGLSLDVKDLHPFGLLKALRKERGVMGSLVGEGIGLGREEAFGVLTHPRIREAQKEGGGEQVFDASDREEGGGVVVWWNDMEKDSRYARWNPSLLSILRPLYPGALPTVKANLFNIVLVLDLSDVLNLNFVSGAMSNIISHIPLRFGLVPVVETEDGKKMARLFYYLIKSYGRRKTLDVFRSIVLNYQRQGIQRDKIDWADVRQAYEELVEKEREGNPEGEFPDLESIVDGTLDSAAVAADSGEDKATDSEAEAGEAEAGSDNSDGHAEGNTKAKKNLSAPLDKIEKYTDRLAAKLARSPKGHVFFNGKHFNFDDDFFRYMQTEMSMQVQYLSEKIYSGTLTDENKPPSMSNYFYDLPNASKRRNVYMFPAGGSKDVQIVSLPELFGRTRFRVSEGTYLYPAAAENVYESLYVVTDLDTEDGLALVKEAISSLTSDSKTRLSFIHNPTTPQAPAPESNKRPLTSYLLAHLHIRGLLSQATPSQLLSALGLESSPSPSPAAASPDVVADVEEGVQAALKDKVDEDVVFKQLTGGAGLRDILAEEYADYVRTSRKVARELKVLPGQSALVVNGRVVGPLPPDDFKVADFKTLEDFEFRKRAEPVLQALQEVAPALIEVKVAAANVVSMVTSVVAAAQQPDPSESGLFDMPPRPRQKGYLLLESQYTSFTIGDNSTALYRIAVLVDPLSEIGQKWSSLLQWLSNIPDVFIEVHLNPGRYADIPLKKFFRYNLLPSLSFDEEGQEVPAQAVFEDLPTEPIYTLAMDVPTAWLVRPRESLYDLDNIQLGKLFPGDTAVEAIFELDYIVIEGHAREVPHNTVARGVQLQLVTGDGVPIDDTLVVANLGYFQFKAKPGVFRLEIREGRGREIFELESVGNEGWDSPTVKEAGAEITVTSFEGLTLYPRLRRLPDMEQADVLEEESDEDDSKKGVFEDLSQKVMSIFKSPKKEPSTDLIPVKPQADINIFTVASGLLYERFVGIMILSVLRNTNSTVKFWFIENFLSPSFLEFIPHMAEKYNFQYELVTYKWPSWLRAQTEKQRIIWAYKILFLDVLFPLDLKKVIFVDADQIVRADLKELVDLDLHGAPYGYVPMGDDNKEMEGFRFWKTGYWKEFLQGKPYHISALYVIDLVRFRQLAAGDILRGQYQQLSADPNSLANLDQDLPNNLQHQVPIYSLPDDWLWCETWCSKDRLHRAKTIDLCQNPLTKEPKLARARQIPEWEEYDAEIARFTRELAAQGKIHSRLAVADVNALAGGAPSAATTEIEETGSEPTGVESGSSGSKEHQRDEL